MTSVRRKRTTKKVLKMQETLLENQIFLEKLEKQRLEEQ